MMISHLMCYGSGILASNDGQVGDVLAVGDRQANRQASDKQPISAIDHEMCRNAYILRKYSSKSVLSDSDIQTMIAFADRVISNICNGLPVPYCDGVVPRIRANSQCGTVNTHSVCYITTVIQVLFSCRRFVRCMRENGRCVVLGLLCTLYDQMDRHAGTVRLVNPLPVIYEMHRQCDVSFDVYRKGGYVSDTVRTICTNMERCGVACMSITGEDRLFWKYPLLRTERGSSVQEMMDVYDGQVHVNDLFVITGMFNGLVVDLERDGTVHVDGKTYVLKGVIERVVGRHDEQHLVAHAERDGEWYVFDDEVVERRDVKRIEAYYCVYEMA